MSTTARAHLRITGTVQGVGYRWFAARTAEKLGLTGWVRNRSDGSVEAEAEGGREAVDEFIEACREGPRFSRVESVDVSWVIPANDSSFEVTG